MKVITEDKEKEIIKWYNLGKLDSEISELTGIKRGTIQYYRKTHNLPTKFDYSQVSKIKKEDFEPLFYKNLSDYKIAKLLNVSPDGVYSFRMRNGYIRESLSENKEIELTSFQKQVLLGTLLGDSSMRISDGCKNPSVSCAHCIRQKEYCEYKSEIFKSLKSTIRYNKRNIPDKRNNIRYENYTMYIPANPKLLDWNKYLYKNKIKVIPFELFEYFTEVSLAFMFMDDGSKREVGYDIATNCFNRTELNKFRIFLLEHFNLETSLFKSNVLYIKACSRKHFTELIKPYIIPYMQYKLHVS